MGQLLSLPMIVLGAWLVMRSYGRARASLERS
jgi:prolipoprotein diacylglyceryltransferase